MRLDAKIARSDDVSMRCIPFDGLSVSDVGCSSSLKLPLNELIVVTAVSGSGKRSVAFDTIYVEGQRRLRRDVLGVRAAVPRSHGTKPAAERIAGIPPAIAIDQTNPVRTSRPTVGNFSESFGHLSRSFRCTQRLGRRTFEAPLGHRWRRNNRLPKPVEKPVPPVLPRPVRQGVHWQSRFCS